MPRLFFVPCGPPAGVASAVRARQHKGRARTWYPRFADTPEWSRTTATLHPEAMMRTTRPGHLLCGGALPLLLWLITVLNIEASATAADSADRSDSGESVV